MRIERLRLALCVEHGEMAGLLGVSRSMLYQVRTGQRRAGMKLLRSIAVLEEKRGLIAPAEPQRADPVSVRFPPDLRRRLDNVARRTGIPVAELVRRATDDFLTRVETEGRIVIPLPPSPAP